MQKGQKVKKETVDYIVKLIWYFIIFSIIGIIVETLFCYLTTGIWECRQGFVYGPFCPIYGLGAVLIIVGLDRFKESKLKIFIYGMIAGAAVEYLVSFILETIYGAKFWDYSYLPYNLSGRICIRYSSYWGFLSLAMIYLVKPLIDKLIAKIPKKETLAKILLVFLIIDAVLTVVAISLYQNRARKIYYNEELIEPEITQKIFSNDFMQRTFPNIRLKTDDGNVVFIKEIIK